MSKTFNKIVYSLLEIATNFNVTDDVEYPVKWVEDAVISVHNSLIREAYKQGNLGDELLQIHANELIKPFENEIKVGDIDINTKSHLCYADIPELVAGIHQIPLRYVGTTNLQNSYSYRGVEDIGDTRGVVWGLPTPSYSILGDKVLLEKKALSSGKYISVIAYFRDPREASTYEENDAFPTPSEYKLEMLGLQHIFRSKGISPDLINDAQRALQQARDKDDDDE